MNSQYVRYINFHHLV